MLVFMIMLYEGKCTDQTASRNWSLNLLSKIPIFHLNWIHSFIYLAICVFGIFSTLETKFPFFFFHFLSYAPIFREKIGKVCSTRRNSFSKGKQITLINE